LLRFERPPGAEAPAEPDFDPSPGMERALHRIMTGRRFESLEEANEFFDSLRAEMLGSIDSTAFATESSRLDDLLEEAELADNPVEAREIYEQVFALDPRNPDALIGMYRTEEDPDRAIAFLEQAISSASDRLGPEFFDKPPGNYGDDPNAEAYAEACFLLGDRLRIADDLEGALRHFLIADSMQQDNDAAQAMAAIDLARGDLEAALGNIQRIKDATFKHLARAMYDYLSGNQQAASAEVRLARKRNGFLGGYLTGRLALPSTPSFHDRPGSKGEAQMCVYWLVTVWNHHPDIFEWMQAQFGAK
jgi:tetratricopeptide (TPR) repeat protein